MRKIGDSNVCPYCKDESSEVQKAPYLPLKTIVGGKYLIGNSRINFTTCRKFKGLEADAIVLVDVTRNTFDVGGNNLVFYVGASRARFRLSIIVNMSDDECRFVSEILGNTLQGKPPKKMSLMVRFLRNTHTSQ